MTIINAYKMDGLGNDFLIIDRRVIKINISKEQIIELGKRDKIGFDQIIFIDDQVENIYPLMIYNSDGNEVTACGNGSRCIAYILGKEKKTNNILLKTRERILKSEIIGDYSVKIDMGKPVFDWDKIPLSKNLNHKNIDIDISNKKFTNGYALNVGNPHIIFFVKNCFDIDLKKIGPEIENHAIFPEKCNVTFAHVKDKNNIEVNVWERGAGLTKACGTAACATAVASSQKGLTNEKINIKFKEGILSIELDKNLNIFMTGPVSEIQKIQLKL